MDQDTVETIIKYGIPVVVVAFVGAISASFRGRRGRAALARGLNERGAQLVKGEAALGWPSTPLASVVFGEVAWSATVPSLDLTFYGGKSGMPGCALAWPSRRAVGEWILATAPFMRVPKDLGWQAAGTQALGLLRTAALFTPGEPPALPDGLALAIAQFVGAKRDFALHAKDGVLHLVVLDRYELDEPMEFWIGASGCVDKAFAEGPTPRATMR